MARLYCYASGQLLIGDTVPDGALEISRGRKRDLERILPNARLSADGETYVVPGVPEASNQQKAMMALLTWKDWAIPAFVALFTLLGAGQARADDFCGPEPIPPFSCDPPAQCLCTQDSCQWIFTNCH